MRTPILLLLFICLITPLLSAQEVEWVKSFSSSQREGIWDVEVDQDGNILVLGFHTDTMEIDGIQVPHHGDVGQQDFFLAKIDPSGQLLWVNAYTGPGFDRGQQIALDDEGNIYLGCLFSNTIQVVGTNITSFGGTDAMVIKLDSDGDFHFARRYGGINGEICYGIHHDGTHLIATGHYGNGAQFDGNSLNSNGNTDMWVARLNDDDGSVVTINSWGGPEGDRLYQVIPIGNGEYVASGYFSADLMLDASTTLTSSGGFDALFLRLDNNLEIIDYRQGAGPGTANQATELWNGPDGSYYCGGYFSGTMDFADTTFSNSISNDGFLVAYGDDNEFQWGLSNDTDAFGAIGGGSFDQSGHLFVAGTIADGDYFGITSDQSYEESAVFVGRFDPTSGILDRFIAYDGPGTSYASNVEVSGDYLYLGLAFANTIDIDGQTIESGGQDDVLLVKLKADELPDPFVNSIQHTVPELPTTHWYQDGNRLLLWTENPSPVNWQIFNAQGLPLGDGLLVSTEEVNIQDWAPGVYFLRLQHQEALQTITLAIVR